MYTLIYTINNIRKTEKFPTYLRLHNRLEFLGHYTTGDVEVWRGSTRLGLDGQIYQESPSVVKIRENKS